MKVPAPETAQVTPAFEASLKTVAPKVTTWFGATVEGAPVIATEIPWRGWPEQPAKTKTMARYKKNFREIFTVSPSQLDSRNWGNKGGNITEGGRGCNQILNR